MHDLTIGSIPKHVFRLSAFLLVSMVFQTLYFLADLYWVGRLGPEAIAAVGLSGNWMMVVLALTQTLGVGTTALVSHGVGRKDPENVQLIFNQSLVLSLFVGVAVGIVGFALRDFYCRQLGADPQTVELGKQYLLWFIPALVMQFALVAMSSALRGTGNLRPSMMVQIATVILNIVLAPILIFGWVTHHPLGVAGAAIASLIAITLGSIGLTFYFLPKSSYLKFHPSLWRPQPKIWWQISRIGLPAGGEFALMAVYLMLVYVIIRTFGASAQAGFGVGSRVMQAIFMPAVAIGFALAPIAGQNFGARQGERVRHTFHYGVYLVCGFMLAVMVLCQLLPQTLIRFFSHDPTVIAFGAQYLKVISLNFLPSGLIFVSSSIFQGIGNTIPPLLSSMARLILFAVPAYLVSMQPGFDIRYVWYLSVASVTIQMMVNLYLLQREFNAKLDFPKMPEVEPAVAEA